MTEGLYEFNFDCGRAGFLTGVFISTDEEVQSIIGKEVYFGEVLGKHSDVFGTIDEGEITLVTNDETVVSVLKEKRFSAGYNPFDYLDEEE